ncbi:DUF6233 domain-containing protein [Streptomyces sp. 5.8]|uniref:DUF6233 domain-containing protein n=1 Tax=Streptomyces sp. 5.8 TaxID=3406571 RepID=UPI003BB7D3C3
MKNAPSHDPPPVRVVLPDGQALIGGLLGWSRSPAGGWLGKVTITVWQEAASGCVEAAQQQVTLPAAYVRPVSGVSYHAVRTGGAAAAGIPGPDRPATAAPAWPPPGDRWVVCPKGMIPDARLVHHADCWLPAGGETVLTGDQARRVLVQPGVSACDICGVDRLRSGERSRSRARQSHSGGV